MNARILPTAPLLFAALLPWLGACGDDGTAETVAASCTPEGTEGLDPGQVVPNVELRGCDGSTVDLRALCSRTAAFVYSFAPW